MNPSRVQRARISKLTDLPNVGPVTARQLESIGIMVPGDLEDRDPFDLFVSLCEKTGVRLDPCALDTFMSITDFIGGNPPRPWWAFTAERKRRYGAFFGVGRKARVRG